MAQAYITVTSYLVSSRNRLQDLISPYRYTDGQIVSALDTALAEMGRIRPDIFLDLKYQHPLRKGDLNDGMPGGYGLADVAFQPDGITYNPGGGTIVPVPVKYITPIHWFMDGWLQFQDVTDTQDARAQGFMQKFQTQLMTLSAA
jgi:hypothetical protein